MFPARGNEWAIIYTYLCASDRSRYFAVRAGSDGCGHPAFR